LRTFYHPRTQENYDGKYEQVFDAHEVCEEARHMWSQGYRGYNRVEQDRIEKESLDVKAAEMAAYGERDEEEEEDENEDEKTKSRKQAIRKNARCVKKASAQGEAFLN